MSEYDKEMELKYPDSYSSEEKDNNDETKQVNSVLESSEKSTQLVGDLLSTSETNKTSEALSSCNCHYRQ